MSEYAARELQIPAAIRYFNLAEEHNQRERQLRIRSDISPHKAIAVLGAVNRADEAQAALDVANASDLPATDYRLPDEREEESFDYQVPGDMRGKMATELLTGERQELEDAVIPPASARLLDHLDLGNPESEQEHAFTSEGSAVPKAAQFEPAGPYIAAVTATEGGAPEATLTDAGEWGVNRKGEWIQRAVLGSDRD